MVRVVGLLLTGAAASIVGVLIYAIVKSAIDNAAVFMDDSFRWGGRDS